MNTFFRKFAAQVATFAGSAWAFSVAVLVILIWLALGPLFSYSNTWQLFINTGTTIVTFLMVFMIQNTQNRESKAIHIKLDELIKATRGARNQILDIENIDESELDLLLEEFKVMREKYQKKIEKVTEVKAKNNSHEHRSSHSV